jgi:anti-anti-sigma factor
MDLGVAHTASTTRDGHDHMPALPDLHIADIAEEPRCRYLIDCAGAQLHVHTRRPATVLRVDGEMDASNAELVAQAIRRFSQLRAPLILDLSHLDFLGIAGLRALIALNREHRQAKLAYSVVSGPTLHRLTRVVSDHGLPIIDSVPEALQLVEDAINGRRQLLSGQGRQQQPQHNSSTTHAVGA